MSKEYDTLVLIGRFQPFHLGHAAIVDVALQKAHEVIIVVGSSFAPRSVRNPFTFEERKEMIKAVYPDSNVKVVPVSDYVYDDNAWVADVQRVVEESKWGDRVGLIGHSKDETSYYLKIFRAWSPSVAVENHMGINATDIRNIMFTETSEDQLDIASLMPSVVVDFFDDFVFSEAFSNLCDEADLIKGYHDSWKAAPFPPTFVTTDAVVQQSGYVLLIKRGGFPFKDCWALPGGYLEQKITIEKNMLKELREETCLKVPEKVLRGSIKSVKVFDAPNRDPRGRTITHGFFVDLGYPDEGLPKVKGGDDASRAEWVKLSDIRRDMMAFDHYDIIKEFIKKGDK